MNGGECNFSPLHIFLYQGLRVLLQRVDPRQVSGQKNRIVERETSIRPADRQSLHAIVMFKHAAEALTPACWSIRHRKENSAKPGPYRHQPQRSAQ
jgi:hypothetical protein